MKRAIKNSKTHGRNNNEDDVLIYECFCPECKYTSYHVDEYMFFLKRCPECGELMLRVAVKFRERAMGYF